MQSRAERERAAFDVGIDRGAYNKVFSHCMAYSAIGEKIENAMLHAHSKVALELGSRGWYSWLEKNDIHPSTLHAINISERELEKGRGLATEAITKPIFHLMDAHKLEFEDNTFDMVFGRAILHHLDLNIALREMKRVLKPRGKIVFSEPLGINPVAKVVRYLTRSVRTIDEQPFRFKELSILRNYFRIELHPFQFFSIPFGVLSYLIFSNPRNLLTYMGFKLDNLLVSAVPPMKYFYRRVLIIGEKT